MILFAGETVCRGISLSMGNKNKTFPTLSYLPHKHMSMHALYNFILCIHRYLTTHNTGWCLTHLRGSYMIILVEWKIFKRLKCAFKCVFGLRIPKGIGISIFILWCCVFGSDRALNLKQMEITWERNDKIKRKQALLIPSRVDHNSSVIIPAEMVSNSKKHQWHKDNFPTRMLIGCTAIFESLWPFLALTCPSLIDQHSFSGWFGWIPSKSMFDRFNRSLVRIEKSKLSSS